MEKRSSSLCLEALGSRAAQFIESERAHGCEPLRYASDPSNKECALRRLPRPRAVGIVRRAAGKSQKADPFVGPDRKQWAGSALAKNGRRRPVSTLSGPSRMPWWTSQLGG